MMCVYTEIISTVKSTYWFPPLGYFFFYRGVEKSPDSRDWNEVFLHRYLQRERALLWPLMPGGENWAFVVLEISFPLARFL